MTDKLYYRTTRPECVEAANAFFDECRDWGRAVHEIEFPHEGFAVMPLTQDAAFGGGCARFAAVTIADDSAPIPKGWKGPQGRGVETIVPRQTKDAASKAAQAWAAEHLSVGPSDHALLTKLGAKTGGVGPNLSSWTFGWGVIGDAVWMVLPDVAPLIHHPSAEYGWERVKTSEYWTAREAAELEEVSK